MTVSYLPGPSISSDVLSNFGSQRPVFVFVLNTAVHLIQHRDHHTEVQKRWVREMVLSGEFDDMGCVGTGFVILSENEGVWAK
jgi:hypothetical protein